MARTPMKEGLETILRNPAIWRAEQVVQAAHPVIASSFPLLDAALPESGWPQAVLTELLVNECGTGEISLLLPALHTLCATGRNIALIGPPWLPHARAWEAGGVLLHRMLVVEAEDSEAVWAGEQILRSGECAAVLMWGQTAGRALNHRALQRLHLAAGTGNAACFLYRSMDALRSPSPAPLRLRLAAHKGDMNIHIVKCRGVVRDRPVHVQLFPAHWQAGIFTIGVDLPKHSAPVQSIPSLRHAHAV